MDNILPFVLGAGLCVSLLKFWPHAIKGLVLLMVVMAAYTMYSNLITAASYMCFYFSMGVLLVMFTRFSYTLLLGPLVGRWPEYKNVFLVKGVIAGKDRITSSGSTTTFSPGTFGGVDARTQNYRVDHDTLHVMKADGKATALQGVSLNEHNRTGDQVVYGGVRGQGFTFYMNMTQKFVYQKKVGSAFGSIIIGLLLCIPFVSEFILAGMLLFTFMRRRGMISENPIPTEIQHALFALGYHILTVVYVLKTHETLDHAGELKTYLFIIALIGIPHFYIWYKDVLRFHAYIAQKVRDLAAA